LIYFLVSEVTLFPDVPTFSWGSSVADAGDFPLSFCLLLILQRSFHLLSSFLLLILGYSLLDFQPLDWWSRDSPLRWILEPRHFLGNSPLYHELSRH